VLENDAPFVQPAIQTAAGKAARREVDLLRVLGLAFGLAVLVGNTIGMGILRTPGEVAAQVPSVPLFMGVWIAGAAYALLGALTVAELAAMRPRSGGLYSVVHDALGPYAGFIAGWTDWLAQCGSTAAVAIVLGEYAGPLVPVLAGHQSLTASVVVGAFAALQWRGIRVGDAAQQLTSLVKTLALLALAALAIVLSGEPGSATAARTALPSGAALVGALVVALQSAIFTYDGWTGPIYFGEEIRDPDRNIPHTMIGGVLLVLAIYLALNAAFLRVIPVGEMGGDPFVAASAAARLFGQRGDVVLRVVMMVSLVAAVNATLLMASRVPFAMSRDGFMPSMLQHVERGTPVRALAASVAVALTCIATNTFNTILALLAFLFVANYALTFTGLFVSRRRAPGARRPFRVPGYPLVPGLALAGSVAFMVGAALTDSTNSAVAAGLVALSWPAYRLAARKAVAPRT
jgi:APA family basic amino acid/polyamine antiporter